MILHAILPIQITGTRYSYRLTKNSLVANEAILQYRVHM